MSEYRASAGRWWRMTLSTALMTVVVLVAVNAAWFGVGYLVPDEADFTWWFVVLIALGILPYLVSAAWSMRPPQLSRRALGVLLGALLFEVPFWWWLIHELGQALAEG